jgi:hypothetical protein
MHNQNGRTPVVAVAIAIAALLTAAAGSAVAATGGTFILGVANKAHHTTKLTNTGKGPALSLKTAKSTTPPFTVNRNRTKVKYLNSDKLDGLTATQFQRRVRGSCTGSRAVRKIGALGGVTCTAEPMWALVNANATLGRGSAALVSVAAGTSAGEYKVIFNRDVSACAYLGTIGIAGSAFNPPAGLIGTTGLAGEPNGIFVRTFNAAGALTALGFFVHVVC